MEDHWTTEAACRGQDPNLFYPEIYYRNERDVFNEMHDRALSFCNRCSVREACLIDALKRKERHGIWGGLLPYERDRVRGVKRRGEKKRKSA